MADNDINVGGTERWASAIGGGALVTYGLLRRDLFGGLLALTGAGLLWRGSTGHCPTYSAIGVSTAEEGSSTAAGLPADRSAEPAPGVRHEAGIRVDKTVTINHPAGELFAFWRDFTNLPRFMQHLESVDVQDGTHSHWKARAPLGRTVEWRAQIINEKSGELIAWRSLAGADVDSTGSVTFKAAPGGRGTEVHVSLSYQPPAGKVGMVVAKLFGEEPGQQIAGDLRRFKQLMETGEIPTTDGQSAGKRNLSAKMLGRVEAVKA